MWVSHTKRFFQKKLEIVNEEISKDWGPWLRAQPRKAMGSSRSKWLRDEGDGDWGRQGRMGSNRTEKQGNQAPDFTQSNKSRSVSWDSTTVFANISRILNYGNTVERNEGNTNSIGVNELDSE